VVLVASSRSPELEILEVKSGNILRTIIAHEQGTRASAFSSDGTEIATVGMDNSFKLWNVESGKLLNTYDTSAVFVINRVAFSSYGKLLITGHNDGSMTIWSAETGSILKQFKAHDGWVETIAVSPDGRGLASGGPYGKVKYWNLAKILAE
jgi:WD40 repeat protein